MASETVNFECSKKHKWSRECEIVMEDGEETVHIRDEDICPECGEQGEAKE
tara:strand:- start:1608 stop:1760 length:153 start_codon:yes stop_codon:yes gene_type:complete